MEEIIYILEHRVKRNNIQREYESIGYLKIMRMSKVQNRVTNTGKSE